MSREPKPAREEGEGSENWMKRAFQAGATMEEVADVLALSVFLDMPCEKVKNIIVDAQARAKFGARSHIKRFGHDLRRLAGDPPGHAEVLVVQPETERKIAAPQEFSAPYNIEGTETGRITKGVNESNEPKIEDNEQ